MCLCESESVGVRSGRLDTAECFYFVPCGLTSPNLSRCRRVTAGCQNKAGTGKNMYSECVWDFSFCLIVVMAIKRQICMEIGLSVKVRYCVLLLTE